jgi:NAD(P)H-dependent FMN reductase
MLDHFGGSNFSGKPSGIVTYSMGPYGGSRASMAIQPVLHELGCLPVSKMVAFASASELFKADGTPVDPKHRMLGQLPGMLSQLEWMGVAMKAQREATGLWK